MIIFKNAGFTTKNAMKVSTIAEHLINNPVCTKSYSEESLSKLRKYWKVFDLINIIIKFIHKPILKQVELDYSVSLFINYFYCILM